MISIIAMENTYEKLVKALSCLLEPAPLNQLGMPDYCRYMLRALGLVKEMIEDVEGYYRRMLRSYEEF